MPICVEFIEKIKEIVGTDDVLAGGEINEDYTHDEMLTVRGTPDALVFAGSKDEIVQLVRLCNENLVPLIPRGSGTGLCGASVATAGGVMLDTTRMNRIIDIDEDNMCVKVEPGVMLMDLTEFVQKRGFFYPPDPGEKTATIAGNISTNAGGMRAVKYGVTRDYVRELEIVTGAGDILVLGGKVVKNSSGYSLKDLLVGSEGTLGVILSATLRLLPLPLFSVSLLVPYDNVKSAIETVPALMRSKSSPTAVEFFERSILLFAEDYLGRSFPDTKAAAYLLLTYDGQSEIEVEREYTEAAHLCISNGAADAYIVDSDERKESVWSARSAFLEAIKASACGLDECDVVVPRSRVADFILYSHEVGKKVGIRVTSFGHAGDGNLHVYVCKDDLSDEEFEIKLEKAFSMLYGKAEEFGGKISGEHGIGYAKKEYLKNQLEPASIEIMRSIKAAFDPNNILNPGKIFD